MKKTAGSERPYDDFVELLLDMASSNKLPVRTQMKGIGHICFDDMYELICALEEDTGLMFEVNAYNCPECNEMHVYLTADYPTYEDTGYPVQ